MSKLWKSALIWSLNYLEIWLDGSKGQSPPPPPTQTFFQILDPAHVVIFQPFPDNNREYLDWLSLKFDTLPITRTAFAAKWRSVYHKYWTDCFQILYRGEVTSYIKNCQWLDYHPNCIRDDSFVSPYSLKCNISINNGPIALNFSRRCSLHRRIHISGEYDANSIIRAIKCKYAQIRVIMPKYGQI